MPASPHDLITWLLPASPQEAIRYLLTTLGEDPDREGLVDTPNRVIKSYQHLFSGYNKDPRKLVTIFKSETYDQMVSLINIEMYSFCEHHMLPFVGRCHIAYIVGEGLLGISKLARLMEVYSRRLQIQERLTDQITEALMDIVKPKGAGCMIEAKHFCMLSRGVEKQNSVMVTSSLKGCFKDPGVKDEFFRVIQLSRS